ncbi:MAG: RNA polymerase sigma factor [Methyloligellaceae bacterium]
MVQAEIGGDSVRARLVTLLPRLRRFAIVLCGDRPGSDELLRAACKTMLDEGHRYQRGTPFARWAFSEIYSVWLSRLRAHRQPIAQVRADEQLFGGAPNDDTADNAPPPVAGFLASLPPQQRSAILLVYGEGLSYEDAAKVLDTPAETVAARVSRALAALIDRLGPLDGRGRAEATVEPFDPEPKQANA